VLAGGKDDFFVREHPFVANEHHLPIVSTGGP